MNATCEECGHSFGPGESAWLDDVKVIDREGVRLERRYTCDDCEAAR